MRHFLSALLMTGVLAASIACSGSVRVYDEPHRDYHHWDGHEQAAFKVWVGENHMEYRDYNRLEKRQQDEYWAWRHNHPDAR